MKKLLNPKIFAIITIITSIICLLLSIFLNIFNNPEYLRLTAVLRNLISFVIYGNLFIIIYLIFFLIVKNKNSKVLNILLLITLVISTVFGLFYGTISSIYKYITFAHAYNRLFLIINIFITIFNILTVTVLKVLEILLVFGILTKKKLPYTIFTIIMLVITIINSFISIITIIPYLRLLLSFINLFATIISLIYSCSFILFLYSSVKNISDNNNNNNN